MRLTSKKISYVAQKLSNDETSTDAEMILDIAAKVGAPVCRVAKLVKSERTYFQNHICEYTKIIRNYLRNR